MRTYSADSANSVWTQVAEDLLEEGDADHVESRLGPTLEFVHIIVEITDPRQRWVVARIPALNPAFALAEVVWLLTGRDDTAFLAHWFPSYRKFVGCAARQAGAYGKRLRSRYGIDQIQRAYSALRGNPSSRQVTLQIWNPMDDLPDEQGRPRSEDIPCNLQSLLKVRRGRLEWLQVVRSNDVDRGLPHNLVQFTMLQEVMAGWLGLEVGRYVHVIDSLHWYPEQSERMEIDRTVVPASNTDRFSEPLESSMEAFDVLATRMDHIVQSRAEGLTPSYSNRTSLPKTFENMFAIMAADDARRYGDPASAERMARGCDNPILRQLWARWLDRVGQGTIRDVPTA